MSGRELVILLLGLAIVAVVLRGLYVAINARRGQIKLAIDKNIPQNVDLEALEMAELPGGGARVVTRSLEEVNRQNNALDKAEKKARAINLADNDDESHIPVLMDAVELKQATASDTVEQQVPLHTQSDPTPETEFRDDPHTGLVPPSEAVQADPAPGPDSTYDQELDEIDDEIDDDEFSHYVDNTPHIGEDIDESLSEDVDDEWEDGEQSEGEELRSRDAVAGADDEAAHADDSDAVLLDYDESDDMTDREDDEEVDAMASVAPDYEDAAEDISEEEDSHTQDRDEYGDEYGEDYGDEVNEEYEESRYEDLDEAAAPDETESDVAQQDDEPAPFDADSEIDEFSMTAGERIGGNPPVMSEARQSSLFDDDDEAPAPEQPAKPKAKKGRSLFAMFGRKSEARAEVETEEELTPATESSQHATDTVQETRDAFADPLLDDSQWQESQLDEDDYDDSDWDEPEEQSLAGSAGYSTADVVDELDQKRSASVAEQEAETQQPSNQSDDFEHSEVLVINVTAKDGRVFAGDDLLHILIMSGLKFGDMNIFHKRLSKDNQGAVVFSVANMLNPGTFDLNNMDEFTTLGISFFLALPTPINNLDAFEQMLKVAQDIRDTLGGDLKDDHRNGMTAQTIEHYRQRIRDFELRRLKAVAARG